MEDEFEGSQILRLFLLKNKLALFISFIVQNLFSAGIMKSVAFITLFAKLFLYYFFNC